MRRLLLVVLMTASWTSCVVQSEVTGRVGYLCSADHDCDPGLACQIDSNDGQRRCMPPAPPPRGDGPDAAVPADRTVGDAGATHGRAGDPTDGHTDGGSDARCQDGACGAPDYLGASFQINIQKYGPTVNGWVTGNLLRELPPGPDAGPPVGSCQATVLSNPDFDLTPLDAGTVTVRGLQPGNLVIPFHVDPTHSPPQGYYSMFDVPDVASAPLGGTVQLDSPGAGQLGAFDAQVTVPTWRSLQSPASGDMHRRDMTLTVTWSGATGAYPVQLFGVAGIYGFICNVPDTGSFTISEAFINAFSGDLTLALVAQQTVAFQAEGLDGGTLQASVYDFVDVTLVDPVPTP
jgi:hypothetical protein